MKKYIELTHCKQLNNCTVIVNCKHVNDLQGLYSNCLLCNENNTNQTLLKMESGSYMGYLCLRMAATCGVYMNYT